MTAQGTPCFLLVWAERPQVEQGEARERESVSPYVLPEAKDDVTAQVAPVRLRLAWVCWAQAEPPAVSSRFGDAR